MMEQRAMVLEIEGKPDQAGKIYSSAADAEARLNEAIAKGWRVQSVHSLGAHAKASLSMVLLERV